ncbi:DEAD/DEAH box helicase [Stieleria sp. TO1_6]|uniref:DEAD/DEAH box helicase n=1 Tax=Stieleria tagensis TaxID=2956795 RepID=UPI00209A6BE4|nr:DEAD/DEAH box helicase [Stieleria tagensis]MCO8120557.1 DEAD/DEAH box helicase [Stieleria tagensis]
MSTASAAASTSGGKKQRNHFHRRLGSLTFTQACQLLGDEGAKLLRTGAQELAVDFEDVFLGGDLLRVRVPDASVDGGLAIATITLQSGRHRQLQTNCDQCEMPCLHLGAALDYLLQAKSDLGLAQPPDESVPLEHLTASELNQRALAERAKRAVEERMKVRSTNTDRPWTDYIVSSERSGRTYRVAVRSFEPGDCYCSCPDYRTNRLGTCKHILHVKSKVQKRFSSAKLRAPYRRKKVSVGLDYGANPGIRFHLPYRCDETVQEIVALDDQQVITDGRDALTRIEALENAGHDVTIYPDAEAFIQRQLIQARVQQQCLAIRNDVEKHPLRTELLDATLLPYQLDGIAFAAGAGRAILADDMGLGKTIQGIGVAELLARLAEIKRVLIVSPASLKSQWQSEINRFSERSSQIVLGTGAERADQYRSDAFFTICNYEQVLRDLTAIENVPWDLIILDEGQRIKNWESKTSNVIRQLESPFRLVLSGTPLENRLGDLFTITRFVDEDRLGPAYEFFHKHHVVDERGKTLGYHRLDQLRESLQPILLRRTRAEVAKQLPERTDEVIRVEATAEQKEINDSHLSIVAQIVNKSYMTEMDVLRMQKSLLMARMSCDSTFLVDQEEPEYSSKLERLTELLEGLIDDPTRKIVLFSEWRRMLDRIEMRMDQMGCDYVRLDGQIPQKKRGAIVDRFQTDPQCRVICMTNAGSTGLNLQAANTVINVDLPWNPAVLEQRIARAYRMGQKNPVHIYKLVTVGDTIEERLLNTLASKQELADASIDMQSDVESVSMQSGMEDLKRRLETILDPLPAAAVDQSQQRRVESQAETLQAKREKVSAATGQLISAALSLAGELIPSTGDKAPDDQQVAALTERLSQCVDKDPAGRPQLTITLPNEDALRGLATTLAKLLES